MSLFFKGGIVKIEDNDILVKSEQFIIVSYILQFLQLLTQHPVKLKYNEINVYNNCLPLLRIKLIVTFTTSQ